MLFISLIDVLVDPGSRKYGIDASTLHLVINYVSILLLLAFLLFLKVSLINLLVCLPLLPLLLLSLLCPVQLIIILIVTDDTFTLIIVDGLPMMMVVLILGLLLQFHTLIAVRKDCTRRKACFVHKATH